MIRQTKTDINRSFIHDRGEPTTLPPDIRPINNLTKLNKGKLPASKFSRPKLPTIKAKEEKMEYDYQTELTDYLPIFLETFKERLKEDKKKWGNTWKHRSIKGQDERLRQELNAYWDQYDYGNQDLPYLKMIGNIFINWVREYEKEIYEKEDEIKQA